MAHKRSWHFYLFIIVFSLVMVVYGLWSFTPLKSEVEALIIRRLQPHLGESFLISYFDISPNAISFYRVSVADRSASFSLELNEIRVGIDLLELLKGTTHPPDLIESVTFRNPRISYQPQEGPARPAISPEKVIEEIMRNIQSFPDIDEVAVEDGVIYWQQAGVQPEEPSDRPWQVYLEPAGPRAVPLLEDLDGTLRYSPGEKTVHVDLTGRLPELESSEIRLGGVVDFENRSMEGALRLNECRITSHWPFWKVNFMEIDSASLTGEIALHNPDFLNERVRFDGAVRVTDFATVLFGQHARADSLTIRFDGAEVAIDSFTVAIEDGRGTFWGTIPDLYHPEVDWHLTASGYSAKYLQQSHSIFDYVYEGTVSARGHFQGPFRQMTITATATSPDILYAVVPFNTNSVDLTYNVREKILRFPRLRADFMEFETRGTGQVDFNTNRIQLDLRSHVDVPPGYFTILNGLNGGSVRVQTDFHGDVSTRKFSGRFDYQGLGSDSVLVTGSGPFTLDDELFKYRLSSANLDVPFRLTGTIEELFSEPNFNIMDVKDFPARTLTANPLVKAWLDGRHVDMYFAGPYYSLFSKMKVLTPDRLEEVATATSNIWDIFTWDQKFRGKFKLNTQPHAIAGDFSVIFSRKGIDTRVQSPDNFSGNIFWGDGEGAPLSGQFAVTGMDIARYVGDGSGLDSLFQQGIIDGEMTLSGTVQRPEVRFEAAARDFIVNQVGYYSTRLSSTLADYRLTFDNFWLELNSAKVLNADFAWHMLKDSLDFRAGAEGLESNFLAETLFRDPNLIKGRFDYQLRASGSLFAPLVYGNARIRDGVIAGSNPFEVISLSVEDSLRPGRYFWNPDNHVLKIRDFRYVRPNEYAVHASGLLALDENAPIDLRAQVDGNVLAELTKIDPWFVESQSDGRLEARILGTRSNPVLDQLDLVIRDGFMSFEEVLPPITNIRANIQLGDADNFIHIRNLEGLVDGHRARVTNQREVVTADGPMEPWLFEDIGLNFGILSLETAGEGIPLALFGLMEEGDRGFFAVSGKVPGEDFYFAGPPDLPLARGTVTLTDCRVTFPFIGMVYENGEYVFPDTGEEEKVFDFLMNMRWDVRSIPGNNNRYFVNIPAYVGEVAMDLNIDNTSPGLSYSGRLIDESFRMEGRVVSTRGRVEYLDVNFRVEEFGADFSRYDIYPEVYGKAYTTVRDSTGSFPRDIYLVLYVIDPVTKKEVSKGQWEDFRFKLVSSDQVRDQVTGETQEQVLAYLGYSFNNIQNKAGEVGLSMTENLLIRPLFRPIERNLERRLGLDYVRLRSNFTTNLFYLSLQDRTKLFSRSNTYLTTNLNNKLDPALLLLQSSEITLGKYLIRDFYLTYTGQLVSGYEEAKLGINHTLGLEYRLLYNLLLEVEYNKFDYNPFYSEDINNDLRIRLRHSFNF